METEAAKRREDIKRRVAGLIAKADATNFGPERDAFLAKADQLMAAYQIEQFELDHARNNHGAAKRRPEVRRIDYGTTGNREADDELVQVFNALARMVRVELGLWGWTYSKAVGYPEDLEYLEMLFLSIRLHLALRLEPKPDPTLSMELNLAMLKEAGLKWIRIFELMRDAGIGGFKPDQQWERRIGVKFTGVYTKFCQETNRPRMYSAPEVWRRNFIHGYCEHMQTRIRQMTRDREQAGTGKELVIVSLMDEIKEVLYENFPEKRPHPPECDCDIHHYEKCQIRLTCQRSICVNARKPVKASARPRAVKELVYDAAAARAGANAAATADLGSARGAPAARTKELD